MYESDFCKIYEEYGWNSFPLIMGQAILDYFVDNNIVIHSHLDFCSGTGELCQLFYKNDILTKGVDISKGMVDISRKKYPFIPFCLENITNYNDKTTYDLITCTCDSINHILKKEDLYKVFQNAFKLLNQDGYFIFDMVDKENILLNQKFVSDRGNGVEVEYFLSSLEDNVIENHMKVFKENELIFEEKLIEKIYDKEEIVLLLQQSGFEVIKCDSKIFNEMQRANNKLYVIAKKKS